MNKMIQKCMIVIILILIFVISVVPIYGQRAGIHYTFANPEITNDGGVAYFEFDIMLAATLSSQFKEAQLYLDFNTAAFGTTLNALGNVSITKGELLDDKYVAGTGPLNFGTGTYEATVVDNLPIRLAIQNYFTLSPFGGFVGRGYELSNTLGTTPKVFVHVKMKILDQSEYSDIRFNNTLSQWDLQDYYYTTPFSNNLITYAPVTVGPGLNYKLDEPVPVELVSFTAKAKNKNVLLNWNTATEVNNYGFEVQRQTQNSKEWKVLGFVNGNGSSNVEHNYSFEDKNVISGQYVYRLKQIDNDGKYEYSSEVSVTVDAPIDYALEQNYPNPFNPETAIKFSIPEDGFIKLTVYDLLGREIKRLVNEQRTSGSYIESFNASELNSGVYFYELRVNNFTVTKKMQLIK